MDTETPVELEKEKSKSAKRKDRIEERDNNRYPEGGEERFEAAMDDETSEAVSQAAAKKEPVFPLGEKSSDNLEKLVDLAMASPYTLLGIPENANNEEISAAAKMAIDNIATLKGQPGFTKEFLVESQRIINSARDRLLDSQQRSELDERLKRGREGDSTSKKGEDEKTESPSANQDNSYRDEATWDKNIDALRAEDFYKRLGVPRNASREDIDRAYRDWAQQTHENTQYFINAPDWAKRKISEMNLLMGEARSALYNRQRRAEYDKQLRQVERPRSETKKSAKKDTTKGNGPQPKTQKTPDNGGAFLSEDRAKKVLSPEEFKAWKSNPLEWEAKHGPVIDSFKKKGQSPDMGGREGKDNDPKGASGGGGGKGGGPESPSTASSGEDGEDRQDKFEKEVDSVTEKMKAFGEELDSLREKFRDLGFSLDLTVQEFANLRDNLGYTTQSLIDFANTMTQCSTDLKAMVADFINARQRVGSNADPEAIKFYNDAITALNSRIGRIEHFSMRTAFAIEGQNPASLRVPTFDIFAQREYENDVARKLQRQENLAAGRERRRPNRVSQEDVEKYMSEHPGEEKTFIANTPDLQKRYIEDTKDWFQKNLEILESHGLTFEEQGEHFSRISMAVNHLRLDARTRMLGEDFHNQLETRRNVQRIVRVWDLLPPDGIMQQAGVMKKDLLRDMFGLRSKVVGESDNEQPLIARQFVELENMCEALDAAKVEYIRLVAEGRDPKKDEAVDRQDDIIGAEIQKIREYYKHGGYIFDNNGNVLLRDGSYVPFGDIDPRGYIKNDRGDILLEDGSYVSPKTLKESLGRRGAIKPELREGPLFVDQAIKILQGEAPMDDGTFRSFDKVALGDPGVVINQDCLNEIAGFSATFGDLAVDRLEQEKWAVTMAGKLWSITGRAATHEVQINGAGDFFADRIFNYSRWLYRRALLKDTVGIWMPREGKFKGKEFSLRTKDYFCEVLGFDSKEMVNELGLISGVDYTKEEKTDDNGKVMRDARGNPVYVYKIMGIRGDDAADRLADPKFWNDFAGQDKEGAYSNSFVDGLAKGDETRKMFWGANSFFMNPSKEKFTEMIKVWGQVGEGGRREAWGELLERSLEYMSKDKEAKEVIEEVGEFKTLEMYLWIKEASNNMMITEDKKVELLKKYVGGNGSNASALRWMTFWTLKDFAIHPLNRWDNFLFKPLRRLLAELFGQTFGEDLGAKR